MPRAGTISRRCCRPCWFSPSRSEEHTSELQSQSNLVCRLLLEKKKHPAPALPPSRIAPRRWPILPPLSTHHVAQQSPKPSPVFPPPLLLTAIPANYHKTTPNAL